MKNTVELVDRVVIYANACLLTKVQPKGKLRKVETLTTKRQRREYLWICFIKDTLTKTN